MPRALYVDWKSIYHLAAAARQKQEGIVPMAQFGRMCAKVAVELIGANSPRAKDEWSAARHAPEPFDQEDAAEEDR